MKHGISSVLDTCESMSERNFAWGGAAGAGWAQPWIWALLWASLVSTKGLSSHCCLAAPPAAAPLLCTAWGCIPEQPPGKGPHLPGRDSISPGVELRKPLSPSGPRGCGRPLGQSRRLQPFHWSPFQVSSPGHWAAASAFAQNPIVLRGSGTRKPCVSPSLKATCCFKLYHCEVF